MNRKHTQAHTYVHAYIIKNKNKKEKTYLHTTFFNQRSN